MRNRLLCILLLVTLCCGTVFAGPFQSETENVASNLGALFNTLLQLILDIDDSLREVVDPVGTTEPDPDPEIGVVIEPNG